MNVILRAISAALVLAAATISTAAKADQLNSVLQEVRDPMDGTTVLAAGIISTDGTGNNPPMLTSKCENNELLIFIVWNEDLSEDWSAIWGGLAWKRIEVKLDNGDIDEYAMAMSSRGQDTAFPQNEYGAALLSALRDADTMTVRTTRKTNGTKTAVFDMKRARENFNAVGEACEWRLASGHRFYPLADQ